MVRGKIAGTSCGGRKLNANMLLRHVSGISLAAALSLAVLPQAGAAQEFVFNTVRVEGNQRIEDGTVATYAGLPTGEAVTAGQLNDAYQRILDSGVFETVELIPQGNILLIKVTEYPTINSISIEGNRRLKDEAIREIVESAPRRVFSPAQAERDAANIAAAYSAQGRVASTVTPRIIRRSDNRVDLVFEIAEGDTIEVERISFVGNRAFSDGRLRRVLDTKQAGLLRTFIRSDTLIEDRLEFDKQVLRDFYLSRGYVDFKVNSANAELTRERDAFFLVVDVTEGQQFKFGDVTVRSEIGEADAEVFSQSLKTKSGEVYSPLSVENDIARLETLAVRKGIEFLRVEPRVTRNARDLTLDLEFVLTRGPRVFVERIDIEGNTTTLDRVIRQQFRTAEGDPFNPREIRESAERIRALGFFAQADVDVREGSSESQVVVDVDVEEQPTGSLNLGGSYSATDGFGIAIGLTENNFLGRGQRVGVNISTAQESEAYSFSFSEPYLLGRNLRFDLDMGLAQTDSSYAEFDTERVFFTPGLTFQTSENGRLQTRLNLSESEMIAREVASGADPAAGPVVNSEIGLGKRSSNGVGLTYTYDSRITGLDQNAGFLVKLDADYAGLSGDNEFVKTRAKFVTQRMAFREEVTLRATLEAGAFNWLGNGNSRSIDRFILTPDIMRGFEPGGIGPRDQGTTGTTTYDDFLGGNFYAVAKFDAEFPLGLPEELGMRGGFFYDIGNLWDLSNVNTGATGASVVGESGSFRHAVGVSLLWTTPIGPLRFNFSHALKKEEFDKEQNFDLTLQARF